MGRGCERQSINESGEEDKQPKRWASNVVQNDYGLLVVSQFTLYAKMKGNKPDFHDALDGDQARILFDKLVNRLRQKYKADRIHTGAFGQYMNVGLVNDGPVTIIWDSEKTAESDEISEKN